MRDWNNNGKLDMEDDFITYHICRSMSNIAVASALPVSITKHARMMMC